MMYLDKVGRVTIVINAAGVEARPSALCAQARDQTERCDGRRAVRWGRRERDCEHARITLDSKDLSSHGENGSDANWGNTHNELAAVYIFPFLHVQSLAKVKQTAHYILIPYESVVKRAEVG